jgi:hypothetical protein
LCNFVQFNYRKTTKVTVFQWLQEEKLESEDPVERKKADLRDVVPVESEDPVERKKADLRDAEDDKLVKNLQSSMRLAICIPFSK